MSFYSFSIFKVNEEFLIFCEEQEFSTRLSKEQRYLITSLRRNGRKATLGSII